MCPAKALSGRPTEGADATPEIAAAWGRGEIRANSFARFRRVFGDDGRPIVETVDMGDAGLLPSDLNNDGRLRREGHPHAHHAAAVRVQ